MNGFSMCLKNKQTDRETGFSPLQLVNKQIAPPNIHHFLGINLTVNKRQTSPTQIF